MLSILSCRRFLFTPLCCVLLLATRAVTQEAGPPTEHRPVFVEDFESGSLDPKVWTIVKSGKVDVQVQQVRAAHGKHALQVHGPKGDKGYAFISTKNLPESVSKHLFGRASVLFAQKMPVRHNVLITAGSLTYPSATFLEIASTNNNFQMSFQQQNPKSSLPKGETWAIGAGHPINRWFCLEWEFIDNPDQIRIWVDGELKDEAKFKYKNSGDSELVKGFVELGVGFRCWGDVGEDVDVFYDDIAIDTQKIGAVAKTGN